MKYTIFIMVLGLFLCSQSYAQPGSDLPNNPEDGRCFARSQAPDKYVDVEEKVEIPNDDEMRSEFIAAVYDTIDKKVLIKEAYEELVTIPAVFDTVWVPIRLKDSSRVIEETYRTLVSKYQLNANKKDGKWVKIKIPGCESPNAEDCETLRWVANKPEFKTDKKNMFLKANWSKDEYVDGETELIPKVVVVQPAKTKKHYIPARYKTVKQAVLLKHARRKYFKAPKKYKTVIRKKLVEKGGAEVWVQVVCPEAMNDIMISQIQLALKGRNYYDGDISGNLDNTTRLALETYQNDKGLPIGKLDKESLEAMGFKFETFSQPLEKSKKDDKP